MQTKLPTPPTPPPCRIEYHGLFGVRMFPSREAFNQYKALPLWKKVIFNLKGGE